MAVSASTEFDIDAPPSVIMEILLDVESLPEWSGPHKSAKIITEHEDGSPARVEASVSAVGMTDDQVLDYTWTDNSCSWSLVESSQLSEQQGTYTVTPKGDGSHVKFDLSVELKIKLPGLIVKRAQKMAVDTAKKGLTDEAKRRA
ncbi:SRPBCC family protein [Gordonia sp. PDNC005]|uniref:SRPBCC family protein n=1 Tax=unclassified Gordonia (in: high G+C Gram-positive bacteria) TaxID=2657482 RepID=UPI0019633310|nr:SRPBCC family protein [Gordonia sp. PDNC005]QRY62829.1 SRPBCC family protein [Gordonia sp. PDNC005]